MGMGRTMWCTPTRGLLSAAASERAALPHTLKQPGMPAGCQNTRIHRRTRRTWSQRERDPVYVVHRHISLSERPLDRSWLGSSG